MKKCKDCGKNKKESDYYGIQNECKECTKKRVRINYRKNIEHYTAYEKERFQKPERKHKALQYQKNRRAKYPGKNKARQKINNALRDGKIKRQPCEICNNPKSEAHHPDYRKPLSVQWLCRKHHLQAEGKVAYKPSITRG